MPVLATRPALPESPIRLLMLLLLHLIPQILCSLMLLILLQHRSSLLHRLRQWSQLVLLLLNLLTLLCRHLHRFRQLL